MPAARWGATLTVLVGGVDVSCEVVEIDLQRGKTRLWDPMLPSTCLIVLNAGEQGQPPTRGPIGASASVTVAYGLASRTLFTGTVQQRRLDSTPASTLLNLDCVDAFEKLARVTRLRNPTDNAVGNGESVTARINRWLDQAGFTGARRIDASNALCPPIYIGDNGASVLANLQATAMADGGDFFIDGDGAAVFRSFAWRTTVTTGDALFSDRLQYDWVPYSSVAWREDLDEVQNKVTGKRRKFDATDPLPVTQWNDSSISTYGERGDALDNLELLTDAQVTQRVANVVTAAAQSSPRFDPVVVQPEVDPGRSWPPVLRVHWGSLIATNRKYANGRDDPKEGHVIGERWRMSPNDCTITYRVSGTATWDAISPPRLPPHFIITPDGYLCVPDGEPCDTVHEVVFLDANGVVIHRCPPGSVCNCSTAAGCKVPENATQWGFDDGSGNYVTAPIPTKSRALLWVDAVDGSPSKITERIDGDDVPTGTGFAVNRYDVIPPDMDVMDATSTGGVIGASKSDHIAATNYSGGWEVDFYLAIVHALNDNTDLTIIDLGPLTIHLTTVYLGAAPTETDLEVAVFGTDLRPPDQGGGGHALFLSGPVAAVPIDGQIHHWVLSWDPNVGIAGALSVLLDGVPAVKPLRGNQ